MTTTRPTSGTWRRSAVSSKTDRRRRPRAAEERALAPPLTRPPRLGAPPMASDPSPADRARLRATATEIRRDILRMTFAAGGGHPGGSLSVTDLVTALVFQDLRLDP